MRFTVNGDPVEVDVHGDVSLLHVLRDELGLHGPKDACEQGECGACTVLLDGEPVCSCLVLGADAAGSEVTTVEGIGTEDHLHPVQVALAEEGAIQCGYCTPGIVVSAVHLLEDEPHPSEEQVREALAGNVCRCTGYGAIIRAITEAT